jgi:hypothetical protein
VTKLERSTLFEPKELPEEFEAGALIGSLATGWGFDVETIDCAQFQ